MGKFESSRLGSAGYRFLICTAMFLLATLLPMTAAAHPPNADHIHHAEVDSGTKHGSMADVSRKLSDPTATIWALFTEFDLSFNNGNATGGNDDLGSLMNFQPILPIPLYGEGEDQWKMIVRPAVPLQFAAPRPDEPRGRVLRYSSVRNLSWKRGGWLHQEYICVWLFCFFLLLNT